MTSRRLARKVIAFLVIATLIGVIKTTPFMLPVI